MATTLGPQVPVLQPQLTPPTISLISSANIDDSAPDLLGDRWENGFFYAPEGCGTGQTIRLCAGTTKTAVTGSQIVNWTPYGLVTSDQCSTFGWKVRDYQARATRKLIAVESKLIEAEFWTGATETNNLGLTNSPGAAPAAALIDITPGGPVSIQKMIAYIEQGIADNTGGGRYMIHMRPYLFEAFLAISPQALNRQGNRWFTGQDNIVVPGRGYTGKGPNEAGFTTAEWIYATPMVNVRRSDIRIYPTGRDESETMARATDRTTNTVTFFAERVAIADFDSTCGRLALNVTR